MKNFFLGLGFGVGLGLIFAPAAGEETRRRLIDRASDLTGQDANELIEQGRQRVTDFANQVQERGGDMLNTVTDQAQQLRGKVANILPFLRDNSSAVGMLNSMTAEDLTAIPGIGPVLSQKVIDGRPYNSIGDLLERGILHHNGFEAIQGALEQKLKKGA